MRMKSRKTDWPVFIISGGSLLLFVIAVFLNKDYVESAINNSFAFSIKYFGAFWQVLLVTTQPPFGVFFNFTSFICLPFVNT
ncbi:hypothetical protein NPM03_16920, partial [Bacillus cereus]|nr:hypothetical protein [Bacillus cereus]MCQ6315844.1 hypothetical protein [Bacillus cereus]MCQ6384527.1 hypothetical protein [Bacillus cereus]